MHAVMPGSEIENHILDAADRLLASGAYHSLTMDELAQAANVAPGKLCLYYRTREDVLLAHCDRIVRRIAAVEKEIAAQASAPPSRIRQLLFFRVLAYFDSVQHFADSLDEIFRSLRTELFERRRFYNDAEAEIIASILRESSHPNGWTSHDLDATARAFLSATDSLLPFNCISRELGTRRQLAKRAERIITLVVNGLFEDEKARPEVQTLPRQMSASSYWTHKLLPTAA